MDNWDEVRTAYHVANAGTVSGAAEVLGVHHATVIRHIDALEERLGVKLFQRHARGYTPTDAGHDLLRVARATDDQFSQMAARLRGAGFGMTGELVVTSLSAFSHRLAPLLVDFQTEHPDLKVRYLTSDRVFRLEYGEAHVAIRAGAAPSELDNVALPFVHDQMALYAAQTYIDQHGAPGGIEDFSGHRFIGVDDPNARAPFAAWMREHVPAENITFRSNDIHVLRQAVHNGAGIGFLSKHWGAGQSDLVEIMPPDPDWTTPLWIVTHMDLHRTAKVQTFIKFLKEEAKNWAM